MTSVTLCSWHLPLVPTAPRLCLPVGPTVLSAPVCFGEGLCFFTTCFGDPVDYRCFLSGLISKKPWRQSRVVAGRDSLRTHSPFPHGLSPPLCLLGPSKSLTTQRPCPSRFEERPRRASLPWAEVSCSLVRGASGGRIAGMESRMLSASFHSFPAAPMPGSSGLRVRPWLEP